MTRGAVRTSSGPAGSGSGGSGSGGTAAIPARVLGEADRPAVAAFLRTQPVAGCLIAARIETASLDPSRLGAQLWGWGEPELAGLCLAGANLVPLTDSPVALAAFVRRASESGRRCSSLVGPADAVLGLWGALEPIWGPARDVRAEQPLMAIDHAPSIEPDAAVRVQPVSALETLLPACVAMFTEEVGVSPVDGDGGRAYRSRVRELLSGGRCFARIEDGEVVFKAELGAVSASACQIQGVWVAPHRRGEGLAAAGTAAVVRAALDRVAPVVSLYVNDYNTPAIRTYVRVGFTRVGTFATVLF